MDDPVRLTGRDLDLVSLARVARNGVRVEISDQARARITAGQAAVARAVSAQTPVYGVTTGLGARVTDRLSGAGAAAFSLRTLRSRAAAIGDPLPRDVTRAALLVRLNGLCAGGAGAGMAVAEGLAGLLNAGVHPRIPASGSVGAADLCLLAHVGLVLIGEGEAELHGETLPGALALERCGLEPVVLGAKDGLAICSSSAVTTAAASLARLDADAVLAQAQVSAALAMEGFRANLTPLDPRVVDARPAPGQRWSAAGLRGLLAGGELTGPGVARRLQDPLSLRCASQIHGSLRIALDGLDAALAPELNGAADNPLVLPESGEILSTGNFHVPALALALDSTAIAMAQVASALSERPARLRTTRLSGLPASLIAGDSIDSGLAPLAKTAQALCLEIRHRAAPLAIHAMVGADGVEDDATGATQGALRLGEQITRLRQLVAIELIVAAQAVTLAAPRLGFGTQAAYDCVRELVAPLTEDRPPGPDVARIESEALRSGALLDRVRVALA
ncbi:MAG: aromatic amino acid lyase [Solirubrobacteraceae bacterium]